MCACVLSLCCMHPHAPASNTIILHTYVYAPRLVFRTLWNALGGLVADASLGVALSAQDSLAHIMERLNKREAVYEVSSTLDHRARSTYACVRGVAMRDCMKQEACACGHTIAHRVCVSHLLLCYRTRRLACVQPLRALAA